MISTIVKRMSSNLVHVDKTFSQWLQSELDKRGWGASDLAREMKLKSPSTIYRILNEERGPGKAISKKIAKALKLDDDIVLYHAGFSDKDPQNPKTGLTPFLLDIVSMLQNKSEQTQRAAREAVELFLENFGDGKRNSEDSKSTSKSK